MSIKKSTIRLKNILSELSLSDFEIIRDNETADADCKSIQSVVYHVIHSGYTYANYINQLFDVAWVEYETKVTSPQDCITEINQMLEFSEKALHLLHSTSQKEIENYSIKSRWGVTFDVEQLMEHAIVHILRHCRQIESFLY